LNEEKQESIIRKIFGTKTTALSPESVSYNLTERSLQGCSYFQW